MPHSPASLPSHATAGGAQVLDPSAAVARSVRTILYLAAFQASRRAPEFIHFREYLQAAEKSVKAAIIATARKLVVTLNAMLASGTDYRPAAVV